MSRFYETVGAGLLGLLALAGCKSTVPKVGGPIDLAVSNVYITPKTATESDPLTLIVDIKNYGTEKAPPSVLLVSRKGPDGNVRQVFRAHSVPEISGGKQIEYKVPLGCEPKGESSYKVMIDPSDLIGDKKKENNYGQVKNTIQ